MGAPVPFFFFLFPPDTNLPIFPRIPVEPPLPSQVAMMKVNGKIYSRHQNRSAKVSAAAALILFFIAISKKRIWEAF
jgi:hypothetical protein